MITIFDRYFNITNREDFADCTEEKLEVLSKMLTEYGVPHTFCLTSAEEIQKIEDGGREYCVTLMYETEKEVTCELVYMLWTKIHRGASDKAIYKAFRKKAISEEKML